jgi:PAS domain S-box-containing protein
MKRLDLAPRITLAFVLFAAALLALVGSVSYETGRAALQASATTELLSAAVQKETQLNGWVDERLQDVTALAASPTLHDEVVRLANAPDSSAGQLSFKRTREILKSSLGPQYVALSVLHATTGKVLVSTRKEDVGASKKGDSYFENGKNNPYVKNPYFSASLKAPAMAVSTPIRSSEGRMLGVLVARLDLKALNAIVGQRTGLRSSDDAYLVNPASQFVTQPRFNSKPVVLRETVRSEAVRLCLRRNSGVYMGPDYRGIDAVIVYRWMPARQLGLIVKMNEAEALAPANDFGRTIVIISGLALLFASLLAFRLARGISRPVRALQAGVALFGQGELDTRLPEDSTDEVGLLAREFNAMAAAIARKERQLRESGESLRLMIESVQDYAIIMLDPTGRIASWNAGAERFKGYSAAEIVGEHISRFYLAEDIAAGKPEKEIEVATKQNRFEDEGWRVRKDGSKFWANVVVTAVRDETGQLRGFSKVTRDITQRKQAEDEILQLNEDLERRVEERTAQLEVANREVRESARVNQNMMEYSQDVICSISEDGRFISVSPACQEVWGYSPAELEGHPFIELVHPEDVAKTSEKDAEINNGNSTKSFENRYVRKDGSTVHMLWSAGLVERGKVDILCRA